MRANWQPTTGFAFKEDGVVTDQPLPCDQVRFTEKEWIEMAALARFSKDDAAPAKLEIEQLLGRFSQRQANSGSMPANQISAALEVILASARELKRQLRTLRETPELCEAYATSFTIRPKVTAKDKKRAEHGLSVWRLALEEAGGDPDEANRVVRELVTRPNKNQKELRSLRAISGMHELAEEISGTKFKRQYIVNRSVDRRAFSVRREI